MERSLDVRALEAFLDETGGLRGTKVRDLRRLAGGASRETWAFEAEGNEGTRTLVLRLDPEGAPAGGASAIDRRSEFAVLRGAEAAGVPVPRVHGVEPSGDRLGAPFLVLDFVEGEAIPRRLLRDDRYRAMRATLASDLGRWLASVHRIDPAVLPMPSDARSAARRELARFRELFDASAVEPHPAIELGLRWLELHEPPRRDDVVVHGDYRLGNVLCDERGVTAILDWELAHVGDPAEDLGWVSVRAWRFGHDDRPAAGVGSREALLEAYEGAAGVTVEPERVAWWETFGNVKWAIICVAQARTHLDGRAEGVELAALGRRTAESELEILERIAPGEGVA